MDIRYCKPENMSEELFKKLVPISMKEGIIRPILISFTKNGLPWDEKVWQECRERIVKIHQRLRFSIAYNKNGNPIGVAILDRDGNLMNEPNLISVFVMKRYRGKGIGKMLVNNIAKHSKTAKRSMRFCPWKNADSKFFLKCGLLKTNQIY